MINDLRDIPILEPPSLKEQAERQGWKAGVFNFGKAKTDQFEYFNSSFVSRADGDWLITRRSAYREKIPQGFNDLVAFKLNGLSPVIGHKIKTPGHEMEHFEDPRAIQVGDRTFISSCTFILDERTRKWTGAHQVLLEVNGSWQMERRWDIPYGKNGTSLTNGTGDEKNWIWFWHEGHPHLVYSAQPHRVCRFTPEFAQESEFITGQPLGWNYGEIRGGTPPVQVGKRYWTFFHSSVPWTALKRRYFMGAYCFEAKPPFRILGVTPKPLLIGSWRDRWKQGVPLVVFPNGAAFRNGTWLVVGGQNDLDSFHCEIPHTDLVKLTEPTGAA